MTASPPKPITISQYLESVYPAYALMAGMQLDVFSTMKDGAKSASEIADDLAVNEEKLGVLLYALVAAKLLHVQDGKFANTDESAFYLVNSSPAYFGDIHKVLSIMWDSLPFTAETIRTNEPQAHVDYQSDDVPDNKKDAFDGMHKLSLISSRDLLKYFDSNHRRVVDIGGGSGGLSIALTQALPDLEATIIDLKPAIDIAHRYVDPLPHRDRVHLLAHNIVADPLDTEFDAAIMRAFTQVISPGENRAAIKHTFDALTPGGCLYIIARIVDDSRTSPRDTALLNLVFLNSYEGGRAFAESDYREWLAEAGFINVERFTQSRGDSVMRAIKPD